MDRRDVASWLEGPGGGPSAERGYPGQRLGRPENGPRSIGGLGRRLAALAVDWVLCLVIARAVVGPAAFQPPGSLAPVIVLAIENALLVSTAGATIGHRVMGLRIETLGGVRPGPLRAVGRAVLLSLVLPAVTLLIDRDQRGLHDHLTGTLVARR